MLKFNKRLLSKQINLFQTKSYAFSSNNYYGDLMAFETNQEHFHHKNELENYIHFLRKNGHNFATIDPLGLMHRSNAPELGNFGINPKDSVPNQIHFGSTLSGLKLDSVGQLSEFLTKVYAKNIGVEFEHIQSTEEREWLYNRLESLYAQDLSKSEKLNMHYQLLMSEFFDQFLQKKFETFKRYSGEGAEGLIVALNTLFARASASNYSDVVLGIPHRGRLNVLVGLLDYPVRDMLYKITGKNDMPEEIYTLVDDVVSHIACSNKKLYRTGSANDEKEIQVTMLHNPSHLEAQNAVSMGKARAKQDDYGSADKALNIQVHGDAAFSAQGIVYEGLALTKVRGFTVGGTVHIICNNQIGYTTTPKDGRSFKYSSCIAKGYEFPIVHVNGSSPEDIFRVSRLALEYKNKFKKDFFIDLICYRKYGHNEVDEPEFTQPKMYHQIRKVQVSTPMAYHKKLVEEGIAKEEDLTKIQTRLSKHLDEEYAAKDSVTRTLENVRDPKTKSNRTLTGKWSSMDFSQFGKDYPTASTMENIKEAAYASCEVPSDFTPHPRIHKFHLTQRVAMIEKGQADWATAEAIAFGTLLKDGYNLRLAGEDVERGTFSQRHLGLTDSKNENKHYPLKAYVKKHNLKGRFDIVNTPLTENAAISYEYGYSIENPNNMVIWEAQFGDFFNTAQQTIDTYFSCGEAKWMRQCGLTLLLPHGFDGTGPEHSSCRIERFLQTGATDGIYKRLKYRPREERRRELRVGDEYFFENSQDTNYQVANPSTPANYFHLLRRQMMRNYRKPLVVASPKLLLRHPQAKSKFEEMGPDSSFKPIITTKRDGSSDGDVSIAIICSGKTSYDIAAMLKENEATDKKTAILRIEELLPFPEPLLKDQLAKFTCLKKVIWFQEEPYNGGAFAFVEPHIERILTELNFDLNQFECIARRSIATIATGAVDRHKDEAKALFTALKKAL